jgi:hypothetical protein
MRNVVFGEISRLAELQRSSVWRQDTLGKAMPVARSDREKVLARDGH